MVVCVLKKTKGMQRMIYCTSVLTLYISDEKFYKVAEVEKRLSLADFGEGFEPTDATHYIKSSLTVTTLLNENLKVRALHL